MNVHYRHAVNFLQLFLFVAPAVPVPVEEPFATEITAGHDAMDPVFSIFEDSRSNDVPIDDGLSDVQLLHDERLLKSRSTSQVGFPSRRFSLSTGAPREPQMDIHAHEWHADGTT